MTDIKLFELLEKAGQRLVTSKFGTLCPEDKGFVTRAERDRVLRLFNDMEISFYNPIIHKTELLWACQEKMVQKRGGNLCAPVPKKVGHSGYIQNMPKERLERLVEEYRIVCQPYPRHGVGVEPKVTDVGMEEFEH